MTRESFRPSFLIREREGGKGKAMEGMNNLTWRYSSFFLNKGEGRGGRG